MAPRLAVTLLASYTGEALLDQEVTYLDLGEDPGPPRAAPRPPCSWAGPRVEDGRAARWVTERYARFALPLAWRGPILVRVEARALETREPQAITLEWNGVPRGERRHGTRLARVRLRRARRTRCGWARNVLVLRFARAPIYFRVRGEGPREVRPAALSWLTLNRAGPEAP